MSTKTVEELYVGECQHPSRKVWEGKARLEGQAIICGGCRAEVVPVFWLRPMEDSPWLIVRELDVLEDYMLGGDSADVWQLRRVYMTPDEIEDLPEHEGW